MPTNSNPPLVSTLICTHNAEAFFDATIRSVLDQTYTHQEILIRDDGSSDDTVELITQRSKKDDRIRVFVEPGVKRGPYGGLNYLLDHAQGTYIAIQDHDDIRHPEKLERQAEFLEGNDEYEGVGSAYTIYIEGFEKLTKYNIIGDSYGKNICHHTSLMYRNTSQRYDSTLERYVDLDFMLYKLGHIYEIEEVYMMHRERADGNNLFTKRSGGFRKGLELIKYKISLWRLIYYIYRSIVGEYILRWMSIYVFSRGKYTSIKESKHKWLLTYL